MTGHLRFFLSRIFEHLLLNFFTGLSKIPGILFLSALVLFVFRSGAFLSSGKTKKKKTKARKNKNGK
jgi:hypothetical protein